MSVHIIGESNAGHSVDYNCSFSAMIDDWRKKFHEHSLAQTDDMFPFGFVQVRRNEIMPIFLMVFLT